MKLAIVALALGIAVGSLALEPGGGSTSLSADESTLRTAQSFERVPAAAVPPSAEVIRYSLAPIVKKAIPAVVNVYATRSVNERVSPLFSDPFFRQFFGDLPPSRRAQQSLGSGVIVDAAGIVVTNLHVIADADQVKIVLSDQREAEAEIVLKDRQSDLAVLKIKGEGMHPYLELANSDELEVGDLVLAIGNPFGVGQTVTSGIISALARSHIARDDEKFYVQTDAAINPGNSGGGLIDMAGRLVGINTAIFSPSGGSSGIGFAVPSNMVRVVVEAALAGRPVQRPWLGAQLQPVTPEIAAAIGVDRSMGAMVSDLAGGGPAAKAGLRRGDLITRFGDKVVTDPGMLNYLLATGGIGRTAHLTVLRGGEALEFRLALVPAPESIPRDELTVGGSSPFAGATVVNMSPAASEELGLIARQTTSGVVVVAVEHNSPAGRLGLRRGDIVLDVNGVRIETTRNLDGLTQRSFPTWRFTIERDGRIIRSQIMGG